MTTMTCRGKRRLFWVGALVCALMTGRSERLWAQFSDSPQEASEETSKPDDQTVSRGGTKEDVETLSRLTPAQRRAIRMDPVVRAVLRAKHSVVAVATSRVISRNTGNLIEDGRSRHVEKRTQTRVGVGSGVVVNSKGYVVTNAHVVKKANNIFVRLGDGKLLEGKTILIAEAFDLAVIKVKVKKGMNLPVATLGSSKDLFQGETVVAIGTPFGLTTTVSRGVISSKKRSVRTKSRSYAEFLQTDAAINPGNSGGPLVNTLGEVVGINTAVHRGGPGIGFAIPVDRVKRVLKDLMKYGYVRSVYLGFSVASSKGKGARVVSVDSSGPAARAGIKKGDVVLELMGQEIEGQRSLRWALSGLIPGQKIEIELKGREVSLLPIILSPIRARKIMERRLGIQVANASRYRRKLGLSTSSGVMILKVRRGSPAHRAGWKRKDVLVQVGNYVVRHTKHMSFVAVKYHTKSHLYFKFKRGSAIRGGYVKF